MPHPRTLAAVFTLFLLSFTVFPACSEEPELDLRLHLKKGDAYQFVVQIEVQKTIWLGKDRGIEDIETKSVTWTLTMHVLDVDADGNSTVCITYDRFVIRTDNGRGGVYEFDSDHPPQTRDTNTVIAGQTLTLQLSPCSEVLQIEAQKFQSTLSKTFSDFCSTDAAMVSFMDVMEVMDLANGENGIKRQIVPLLTFRPNQALRVGTTWTRKELGIRSTGSVYDCCYTLTARHDGNALIAVKGKLEPDPDIDPNDYTPRLADDVAGVYEGTLKLDEASGMVVEGKLRTTLDGEMLYITGSDEGTRRIALYTIFDIATTFTCQKLAEEPSSIVPSD